MVNGAIWNFIARASCCGLDSWNDASSQAAGSLNWDVLVEVTHIFVDFENVQPQDMSLLSGDRYRVVIFRGPHQNKLEFGVVEALQPLGSNVTYVRSDKHGKNALDFHIAFYLGRLVPERLSNGPPDGKSDRFIVITKDGGFDALLSHVRSLGYEATKAATIRDALGQQVSVEKAVAHAKQATAPKVAPAGKGTKKAPGGPQKTAKPDILQKLIANFRLHPKARPSTRAALERHIGTALGGKAAPAEVQDVIATLGREGVLKVSGEKVEYTVSSD
jgi:hypothetical protein